MQEFRDYKEHFEAALLLLDYSSAKPRQDQEELFLAASLLIRGSLEIDGVKTILEARLDSGIDSQIDSSQASPRSKLNLKKAKARVVEKKKRAAVLQTSEEGGRKCDYWFS